MAAKTTKELKNHAYNPRKISKKQFSKLEETMNQFGDLSGIVHNLEDNQLISGNQRTRVFNLEECEITLIEELDKPNKYGTVAYGYIDYKGERFNYRQVRWEEAKANKAMVIANKAGGEFDLDLLANLPQVELEDLKDIGFTDIELGLGDEPKLPPQEEPKEKRLSVEVFFEDEQAANDFFGEMESHGYTCKLNR